jgi:hypothetical protein
MPGRKIKLDEASWSRLLTIFPKYRIVSPSPKTTITTFYTLQPSPQMAHLQSNSWNQIARSLSSTVCQSCRKQLLQTRSHRGFSSLTKLHREQSQSYQKAQFWQGLEWVGTKEWLYNRNKGAILGQLFVTAPIWDEFVAHTLLALKNQLKSMMRRR